MSVIDILYTILIGPLQLVFEIIYSVANQLIGHPGLSIVVLSLLMNLLVLPLYKRADAMQEEARDIDEKLKDGVAHIKKTFSGDERMMILQTYYRQNNYKPTDALNGSVSLLLEIPFFMAAYNFLSHLEILKGATLGPITDLGAPDGLIVIGSLSINLLPILMTVINVVSSSIYLKGFPLKMKVQLYAMAGFFLVFLYTSPSGLVFYWTLNNVFSLVKNLVYKVNDSDGTAKKVLVWITEKFTFRFKKTVVASNKTLFVLCSLFLTVLVGFLIPSTLIAASPQEFIDITYYYNPVWYVVYAACLSAGTFMIWMRVFYWLANERGKALFDKLVFFLCGIMLVDYMFFGTRLGIISPNLQYENGLIFGKKEMLLNILVVAAIVFVFKYVMEKWRASLSGIVITAAIALFGMSVFHISDIQKSAQQTKTQIELMNQDMPHFSLSKEGKNVVVIMIDRAMGQYVPYMFNEKPQLKEKFDGFTYYSNTISFGTATNICTPALFGGYEYTPVEMNKRNGEPLVVKHNEALKVMPVLFDQNDYEVTVCDPPYANYGWFADLSIYDMYPDINAYVTNGVYGDEVSKVQTVEARKRNMFCYSLMKTMPIIVQGAVYDGGNYNAVQGSGDTIVYSTQIIESNTKATGLYDAFMYAYNVLLKMPEMTKITDDDTNTFLAFTNYTTHEPNLLQLPEYEPAMTVNNTAFKEATVDSYTVDGKTLKMEDSWQHVHYHINMTTMIQLANWFDYLRENDVYDNTRIILVSDHGKDLRQVEELMLPNGSENIHDAEYYYPLLMVKDFNSTGFTTSDEFMTNADVPTIAVDGLIEKPTNPFTGKEINNDEKYAHEQYIFTTEAWDTLMNNGYTFLPATWYAVKDNIWEQENWRYIDEESIIPSELSQ